MYNLKESDGTIILTGYKLKFYYEEQKKYEEEYHMSLTQEQVKSICKKLCRHFKIRVRVGGFRGKRTGHYIKDWTGGGVIVLPVSPDLGILCHEISHGIHHQKYGKSGHTRQLSKIMDRVIRYCQRKNYWKRSSIFDFLEMDWETPTHTIEGVGVSV